MTNRKRGDRKTVSCLDEALAALIKNTKTTRRHLSITEIARWLETAVAELGSIAAVASRIDLSPKMLRQFLAVKELSAEVQSLFNSRRLDSVDAAVHLRQLSPTDQFAVASAAAEESLNTSDIRAVVDLRKNHPEIPIGEVIERVVGSKNIKEFVIEFIVRGVSPDKATLLKAFRGFFGDEAVRSLHLTGSIGRLVVSEAGAKRLRDFSQKHQLPRRAAIDRIVGGKVLNGQQNNNR